MATDTGSRFDIDSQVLVCAEVIDDSVSLLAVDHRRVEAARLRFHLERACPGHCLTIETVHVGVILDPEPDVGQVAQQCIIPKFSLAISPTIKTNTDLNQFVIPESLIYSTKQSGPTQCRRS
jgi:hypothetical protein